MAADGVRRIVVMGVAGSGKTTVGRALARRLDTKFVDADDAHPPANIEKMRTGIPLTDADRRPWLLALRDRLASSEALVVTCSALKREYREMLREAGAVTVVFLDVDQATALERLNARDDHFMKAGMLQSQFDDLERPESDEHDVFAVDAAQPVATLLDLLVARLDP